MHSPLNVSYDVILLPDNVHYCAAHRAQDQLIAICWQVVKNVK